MCQTVILIVKHSAFFGGVGGGKGGCVLQHFLVNPYEYLFDQSYSF